jgi:hypothetical protein
MTTCPRTVGVPPGVRDRLTASDLRQAVSYQPITRDDVAGGYPSHQGLAAAPAPSAPEETS